MIWIHIRSHVITRQSQSYNFQKFAKILEFCNNLYMCHTFLSFLIRCANMKWIRQVLRKIQSGHDFAHRQMDRWTDGQTDRQTDRQTDGRTDDVKPVYPPFKFVEGGVGYNYIKCLCLMSVGCVWKQNKSRMYFTSSHCPENTTKTDVFLHSVPRPG